MNEPWHGSYYNNFAAEYTSKEELQKEIVAGQLAIREVDVLNILLALLVDRFGGEVRFGKEEVATKRVIRHWEDEETGDLIIQTQEIE